MIWSKFDLMSRALTRTRRSLLGGVLGIASARFTADAAEARKQRTRGRKPRPNAFGCLDVGEACKRDDQCCSSACQGKKGKKRCKAHDTGGCQAGSHACDGVTYISCLTSSGTFGRCETTTGNAGYCAGGGDCRPCTKDADCQALCGPRAACVVCEVGCSGVTGTACVGPDSAVCPL